MKQIDALMKKEISRKEFLGMSGLAVATVFGLGGLLKALGSGHSLVASKQSAGYGSSPYGG